MCYVGPTTDLMAYMPLYMLIFLVYFHFLLSAAIDVLCFKFTGPSISNTDNCTAHCFEKNLICTTEFTELEITEENIDCIKSDKAKWSKDYHPSYNVKDGSCEGFKEINTEKLVIKLMCQLICKEFVFAFD